MQHQRGLYRKIQKYKDTRKRERERGEMVWHAVPKNLNAIVTIHRWARDGSADSNPRTVWAGNCNWAYPLDSTSLSPPLSPLVVWDGRSFFARRAISAILARPQGHPLHFV